MKAASRHITGTTRRARGKARALALAARVAAKAARAAKHKASYEQAERFCERMGRALQEVREGRNLTLYALAQECGVSREMIDRVEQDKSKPTVFWLARVAFTLGVKLSVFLARLEEGRGQ